MSSRPGLVRDSPNFRPACVGVKPPDGIWAHICGSDLVRDEDGTVYVLEDNLRVPFGRVVRAREPDGHQARVPRAVPPLQHRAGRPLHRPPGEPAGFGLAGGRRPDDRRAHAGRAQLRLLRARLPRPADGRRTCRGRRPRRPRRRRGLRRARSTATNGSTSSTGASTTSSSTRRSSDPDSLIGVPGLMRSWRAGRVALVNAPGLGDRRRQGRSTPSCPISSATTSARSRPGHGADAALRRRRIARHSCSPISADSSSSRPTSRADTGCSSVHRRPERTHDVAGRSPGIRAAGSRSPSSRCRPHRPSATGASPRATSISAPSHCSGPTAPT